MDILCGCLLGCSASILVFLYFSLKEIVEYQEEQLELLKEIRDRIEYAIEISPFYKSKPPFNSGRRRSW